jgi:hypothetical protein
MKTIEPVVFPINLGTATILYSNCIYDNLSNSATFYYALFTDSQKQLQEGNLTMTGEDYLGWVTNDYAYNWISTQIDVTITGDFVPPAPPEPEPIPEPIIEEPTVTAE